MSNQINILVRAARCQAYAPKCSQCGGVLLDINALLQSSGRHCIHMIFRSFMALVSFEIMTAPLGANGFSLEEAGHLPR